MSGRRVSNRGTPGRMAPLDEAVVKAAQCAGLLVGDVRDAHRLACDGDPALEILLRDLLADVVRVERRLGEIEGCLR